MRITTKTQGGDQIAGGADYTVTVNGPFLGLPVYVTPLELVNDQQVFHYTPILPGTYTVSIQLNGTDHIRDSSFHPAFGLF